MKSTVLSNSAPQAVGPYSQAAKSGNKLYISGQLGLNNSGTLIAEDTASQARQTLENIKHILGAAGLTTSHIVKTTIFLTDLNDFDKVNKIYQEYFTPPYPARACVQVAGLPKKAGIEIEAIADYD